MATPTTITPKKMVKEESPARSSGRLLPSREFPFLLGRLRDEFDQMFERFGRGWPSLWEGNGWRWDIDVQEEENQIVVRAEAPGFEPKDFDLQVRDHELVLRASRKSLREEKVDGFREAQQQEYYEAFTLPTGIDADKVTARYVNGVLTVTLPKTAEAKGKRVPVTGS
jgi:HSP20 family protein